MVSVRANQRLEPVADRVLDHRLQDQRWDQHVKRRRINAVIDAQPRTKVHLLDVEIGTQVFHLFGKLHFLLADPAQRDAQQIAQAFDHQIGLVGIAMDERRDRVQRVEEEMWMQLLLQRL